MFFAIKKCGRRKIQIAEKIRTEPACAMRNRQAFYPAGHCMQERPEAKTGRRMQAYAIAYRYEMAKNRHFRQSATKGEKLRNRWGFAPCTY